MRAYIDRDSLTRAGEFAYDLFVTDNKGINWTTPYWAEENLMERYEMYGVNPLSEYGLNIRSKHAMQRINDHIDMMVREWEADRGRKEHLRLMTELGVMMHINDIVYFKGIYS